jgi:non-heme chloroperoxidase
MSTITVKDGTTIYYKDWGKGPVVTFSHGWPLNSDAWDGQMLFLAQNGFRVVAHDRRGHGRSSQASSGNDMNGYAEDLAAVIEALDLKDATLVGHSKGGGSYTLYRTPWHKTRCCGCSDRCGAADPGEVRFQPGGAPDRSV